MSLIVMHRSVYFPLHRCTKTSSLPFVFDLLRVTLINTRIVVIIGISLYVIARGSLQRIFKNTGQFKKDIIFLYCNILKHIFNVLTDFYHLSLVSSLSRWSTYLCIIPGVVYLLKTTVQVV